MVDRARPIEPSSPELHRGGDPGFGLIDGGGGREILGPRQRAVRTFARGQDVPRPDPSRLDAEGHVGGEPYRDARPGSVGGMAVVPNEVPLRLGTAVVEHRLADELDLDLALQTSDRSYERVIGVFISRGPGVRRDDVLARPGPHRQGVADLHPSTRRTPGGHEDVRAGFVDTRGGDVDPEGREPETAGFAIEQGPEDAWRIELWDTQPLDRSVRADERTGVAVGQEGVRVDRRERRRHRRALSIGHEATQGSCHRP